MTFRTLRKDALALLFAAAACVALGAVFWFAKAADFAVVRLLNPSRSSFVDEVLHWLDRQGPRVLLATAGLALLAVLGWKRLAARRPAAAAWLLGMAWAQAVVNLGKTVVRRLRPLEGELGEALRRIRDVPDVARSLPSGHVTTATAVAAGLWLVLGPGAGKRRHLLAIVPPLMMWDRMALGLHHPSDALFGAGAGLLCMAAAAYAISFYVRGAPGAAASASAPPAPAGLRRPDGLRGALIGAACVALVLAVTHVFRLPDVARDAGSGAVADGFRTSTSTTRKLLEPFFGPPLYGGAVGGLRTFVAGSAFLAVAVGAVLAWRARHGHRARFALYLAVLLPSAWVSIFCAGGATPDRFKAKDRRGVFVDWHLHGGDPVDGRHTEERAMKRQEARGVDWAITTCHDFRPARAAAIAHGALGTEWSGGDHPRTPAPHVLVLGTSQAVDAAIAEKDALAAVRAAKAHGGLVLVAHHWRSAKHVPNLPTPEAFVDAGADGFEVGNRHADAPAAEAEEASAVARLDALCRERGLLRVSFSDDHGVPAGSPCVTWIEGVTEDDLKREGGVAILSRLRRDADPATRIDPAHVIPLLFDRVAPADRRSPIVAVFLWPLDYLRTLGVAQRASWFLWLAAFWFASRRFAVQERA